MAEADGSARIRGTRGSGKHNRVEFGTRRQFKRYSDTFRFVVVVVVVVVAEGCRHDTHARTDIRIYEAEVSEKERRMRKDRRMSSSRG